MPRLAGSVPVHKDGETTWYRPGDDLPEEVAAQIGEHAFVADPDDEDGKDGVHPFPEARAAFVAKRDGKPAKSEIPTEPVPPPLAGSGSSKVAWTNYADKVGVDLTDVEDSRDAIVEAIRQAGKPVDPPSND